MIAGIDIGGTKTQIIAELNGNTVGEAVVKTAEWRGRIDHDADVRTLVSLLIATAGMTPATIVVGAHGCDSDEDRLALQARLSSHLRGTVLVLNDSELLLPAAGKVSGISVISGTGSIAVSRDALRGMIASGGWGWYLGDEGSASGLVREAARTVRFALDQGEALDPLGRNLLEALAVPSPIELGRALGAIGSAAGIGRFAPLVFDAAEMGSRLAQKVIGDAGKSLAVLTEQLVRRGAPRGDVVTGGGVIARQPRLLAAFQSALADRLPDLTLTLLHGHPIMGAIVLARKLRVGDLPETLPLPHIDGTLKSPGDWRVA
ncbi:MULTISPECIES: BadF/BadG/BcrA/BcrD ATPase family protein [unclassified Rhizobium]|uniref:N-acetylglucosamine kinase n=1 Tax=unclassified Rhizobium TaxID=2613769 RepID=UPI000828C033|nr:MULTISPECIES: BadF/BadG/BcrA/BcrD ATPase family protein [unclassified Rhizobium]OCI99170.1 N-acetylglucosamine kinase [Rhizobium sp. AC27/96]TIX90641.1 N-acetylglucosamine kinase [Rhizobium sp. P44RR-XXIV]